MSEKKRLDVLLTERGLQESRQRAQAVIMSGEVFVNGQRVDIPSFLVKVGDLVAVCEASVSKPRFKKMKEDDAFVAAPKWLDRDKNTLQGKVVALPVRDDIDFPVEEHLIVELYSK